MVTNYQRGYRFELRVKKFFEDLGYYVVRSAGSHGIVDLVCLKGDEFKPCTRVCLVQCKYGSGKISKKEWRKLDKLCKKMFACGYVALNDKKGKIRFRLITDMDDTEVEILERQVEK